MFLAKRVATLRSTDVPYKGMSDEFHRYPRIEVEFLFESENTKSLRETPPDHPHAPRPPGPKLRANIINVADTPPAQLPGQPQMETGKIRQNREGRFSPLRFSDEVPHRANQRGQVAQNFRNADDGNF